MNRSPRRPPRVQPPLRGRSAATSPTCYPQTRSMPVSPQRPAMSGHATEHKVCYPMGHDIHPSFLTFYKRWSGVFSVLDRPWKGLIVLAGLMLLSIMLGKIL